MIEKRGQKLFTLVWISWKRIGTRQKNICAFSFYGSKMILDCPKIFGREPIVLDRYNSFWLGPNHFGQVQITKISPEKSNFNLTKRIWTRPKQFGRSKIILDLQKDRTLGVRPAHTSIKTVHSTIFYWFLPFFPSFGYKTNLSLKKFSS